MNNQPQQITDILAECLKAVRSGTLSPEEFTAHYPAHAADLAALLQTANSVERHAMAHPSPAFRQAARLRLLQKLPSQQPVVTNGKFLRHIRQILNQQQRRFVMNLLAILAVLAATALGGGGVVYASGDALPGDALYGVKTSAEEVQLALSDDAQDINLYNQFLAERVNEMGELVDAQRFDDLNGAAQHYEQNLAALVQTMLENPELGAMLMEEINVAQQSRLQTMTQMMEHTPEGGQARIRQVLNAEAQQLSPGLGEPGHGPGEPGMGAGESGQNENEPGQGPGQPGGPEEPQGGANNSGEPGAGQPQGNGQPGMGGNEPAGTAVPGQGEPGLGSGEPGMGAGESGQSDNEPGQGPGQPGGSDTSSQQGSPQAIHTPVPSGSGSSGDQGNGQGGGQSGSQGGNGK
jgi:hypothetical protein